MKLFHSYIRIFIITLIVIISLRLVEFILIVKNYGMQESLISSELYGILYDFLLSNLVLIIISPVFILLSRICNSCAQKIILVAITLAGFLHLIILKFFLYQLIPLDIVLFQTPINEVIFTVKTSETKYTSLIVSSLILLGIIIISDKYVMRKKLATKASYIVFTLMLLCIIIFFSVPGLKVDSLDRFAQNKSVYFYKRSLTYFLKSNHSTNTFSRKDVIAFKQSFGYHNYISTDYPLLHAFDTTDIIGMYLNKNSISPPNIVLLVVEGLNDDFMHNYKGVELMPFLMRLKNKSLYWNHCLSTSERSFAVMPSITGGLPYGKIGFTLLDHLPRHLSLVSVLHANNYYTTFFYGQGSWFHKKDRFFEQNHIDLIFDNSQFDHRFEKIIVGENKFFWGYNDKVLFEQSFEVMDTLPHRNRLDIYFTGTSHSPFIISNVIYYNKQFENLTEKLPDENDRVFFDKHKKYIESILFLDDALKEFFNNYRKRPEFDNTIFIITGDHPMTELPIENSIKRYHVPLLIYSPNIKTPRVFSNVVSHLDLYETILAYLSSEYNVEVPSVSTSIGNKLIPRQNESKTIVFMNDNKEMIDIYSDGFYLSKNNLFAVKENMQLEKIEEKSMMQVLEHKLMLFKKVNQYVSTQNKIIPDDHYCQSLRLRMLYSRKDTNQVFFSDTYHTLIDKIAIPKATIYFDLSLEHSGKMDNNTFIVYQITDKNDSTLLWKNSGMNNDQKITEVNIRLPRLSIEDTLFFRSYIWNQKEQDIMYKNLNVLLCAE